MNRIRVYQLWLVLICMAVLLIIGTEPAVRLLPTATYSWEQANASLIFELPIGYNLDYSQDNLDRREETYQVNSREGKVLEITLTEGDLQSDKQGEYVTESLDLHEARPYTELLELQIYLVKDDSVAANIYKGVGLFTTGTALSPQGNSGKYQIRLHIYLQNQLPAKVLNSIKLRK